MTFLLQPYRLMLCVLSEYVRREQEKRIEYLQVESQILREQIGDGRILLNLDQRRRLAVKGQALGRLQLRELATIAQVDTILRWHREHIKAPNENYDAVQAMGRPRINQEVVGLVPRMARENKTWGYKKIQGQLSIVGFQICKKLS